LVKEGYRETEIGVIPEDWDNKTLEEICKVNGIVRGPFGGALKKEIFVSNGYKVYEQGNAIYKTIHKGNYYISEDKFKELIRFSVNSGDFIVSCSGTIGKIYRLPTNSPRGVINQALLKLVLDDNIINSEFFNIYFSWDNFNKTIIDDTQGGAMKNLVGMDKFRKVKFPIPDMKEQHKIAEALSDMDNLISSLEKLIEKKKAIKQGAMQELLTGKKRLQGYSGKWEMFLLGDIGTISGSGVDKKIMSDEQPITLLNYTNVYHQISISRKDLTHEVTASLEKIKKCSVSKGDVFLTPTSETPEDIALSAVAIEDMIDVVYSYHVVRLRPNSDHYGRFINYALTTPMFREQAFQFAEGSGIRYVITLKKFKEMKVYMPIDKEEQNAIVSILSDMDAEITAIEQKLAKCQKLKQGMMQQLLTGKIRLVSNSDTVADKPKEDTLKSSTKRHNHQFDDAVVIAGIVDKFYSDKYPLGRKKVQKLLYLFRRHQKADTSAFKKKAAGPYADEVRYKGGEPIAISSKYISVKRGAKGSSFSKGEKIGDALTYLENRNLNDDLKWLCEQFKYTKIDRLELLATIDMAICDLADAGITVTVDSIKNLIKSHPEWKAKLSKSYFKDNDIAWAIGECRRLFE